MINIEEFNKLPLEQKRVLIAQDVLNGIESGFYSMNIGTYVSSIKIGEDRIPEENIKLRMLANRQIHTEIPNVSKCEVCQLGALAISLAKFGNDLKFSDLVFTEFGAKSKERLLSVFTPNELYYLEVGFEGAENISFLIGGNEINIPEDELELISDDFQTFKQQQPRAKDRTITMMQHIVDTGGQEFKLSSILEKI